MCLINSKTRPIYVVIEELILGTAEDDWIVGYFKTKGEAEEFVGRKNSESDEKHYCYKEVFEL